MTDRQAAAPLSAEEEAAQGWATIDRRFLRWHNTTCGTHTFKANRPECDCGLQATLDAARALQPDPLDVERLREALERARLELMQDVDLDAVIAGIDTALRAEGETP